MKLTAQVKLLPTTEQADALLASMRAMNAAASYAAEIGFRYKVFGQIKIHRLCYYQLRERFGLPAQMAIRAIGKAVEAFRRNKSKYPIFAPTGAVPLDDASYRLLGREAVSIGTIRGRYKIPVVVGDYFKGLLSRRGGQADLVYRDGKFYLYISIAFDNGEPPLKAKDWLGVDLGIVNLATDSSGETFSGEAVNRNRRRRTTARKQYQRKGTRNAKRRLKKMSGRQARFQKHVSHVISKRLVDKAKALKYGIALEDLTHVRRRIEPTVSRRFRRTFGNWAFASLRAMIEYKAARAGVKLIILNPRNSSRTCSRCGHCEKANRRSQAKFRCKQCDFSCNADLNAALVLRAWAVRKPAPKAAPTAFKASVAAKPPS